MKSKVLYSFVAFAIASSSSLAQDWKAVQNQKASDVIKTVTTPSNTIYQFKSSGTFTVDQSITGFAVLFGSSTTNVSPAIVQLNSGCTLTVAQLGTNSARPTSDITFQGDGALVISGPYVDFVESGPNLAGGGSGDVQKWYFKQTSVFDLSNKTVKVKNNNFVEMDKATISSTKIDMSGASSLAITSSSRASLKDLILSGTSNLKVISSGVAFDGTTTFSDNTTFNFLRSDGETYTTSASVRGTFTVNKVKSSLLAQQVYVEDGAIFTSNANTSSVSVGQIIMKAGTLYLNTSNAFKSQSSLAFSIARVGAKIILGADNDFGVTNIYKSNDYSAGTLFLTLNGHKASFANILIQNKNSMFYVTDFAEGLLSSGTDLVLNEDGSLYNIYSVQLDETGKILSQSLLYQNKNGYITAVAIPEPAEVAMLFGLFAIAFAVYRRKR